MFCSWIMNVSYLFKYFVPVICIYASVIELTMGLVVVVVLLYLIIYILYNLGKISIYLIASYRTSSNIDLEFRDNILMVDAGVSDQCNPADWGDTCPIVDVLLTWWKNDDNVETILRFYTRCIILPNACLIFSSGLNLIISKSIYTINLEVICRECLILGVISHKCCRSYEFSYRDGEITNLIGYI